jgi:hypothetical protein
MGFNGRTHFDPVFLFRAFPPFRLFMIFLSNYLLHIYRTMLLLYPQSLFGQVLGSWLEHVNLPSDSLSFLLYFDRIIVFLFNPTCTFFLLDVWDVDPARYCVELREAGEYDTR